ncbi:MAG TPA: zf-HC2 domain-containing protein, partial [Polyangiales bacterium]|nr:zf-HC2 domain-containing protein [Polyangiales bacterium]
ELTCKEIVELVTDYLEGHMAPSQRAQFEQHILTCPPCTTYLEQMRTMVGLAATLDAPSDVAVEPAPAVLDAFRRWKRQTP